MIMKTQATVLLAIATALLPVAAWAQSAGNTPASVPPAQANAVASQPTAKLSAAASGVVKLATSGVPETVIKAYIENSSSAFNLTPDNLVQLQSMGISGALMAEMLTQDKTLKDKAAAYAASAGPYQPLPAMPQAPVYTQPPVSYPPPAPDYSASYSSPVTYIGYDYPSYSYPYYNGYYPYYGYGFSYFPYFSIGFGNRFFHGREGGFHREDFGGGRGGFVGGRVGGGGGFIGGRLGGGVSIGGRLGGGTVGSVRAGGAGHR